MCRWSRLEWRPFVQRIFSKNNARNCGGSNKFSATSECAALPGNCDLSEFRSGRKDRLHDFALLVFSLCLLRTFIALSTNGCKYSVDPCCGKGISFQDVQKRLAFWQRRDHAVSVKNLSRFAEALSTTPSKLVAAAERRIEQTRRKGARVR